MNDQEGVNLNSDEMFNLLLNIILQDRVCIRHILDEHNVSSIQYLLWSKEPMLFYARFENIRWLSCPEDFDINVRNARGRTLLFDVLRNKEIFDELLERNIDVNIHDKDGLSAVMFYANYANNYTVCKLLDHGASLKEAKEAYAKDVKPLTSTMWTYFEQYEQRETSCRKSVAGFTLMGKSLKGLIHKDLIPVVANLVWSTRRREKWFKEIKK